MRVRAWLFCVWSSALVPAVQAEESVQVDDVLERRGSRPRRDEPHWQVLARAGQAADPVQLQPPCHAEHVARFRPAAPPPRRDHGRGSRVHHAVGPGLAAAETRAFC